MERTTLRRIDRARDVALEHDPLPSRAWCQRAEPKSDRFDLAGIGPRLWSLSPATLRRLVKRAGEDNLERLLTLRRAEIAAGEPSRAEAATDRIAAFEAGLDRLREHGALALRRRDLALSGREIMDALGCDPGPEVGRALDHLTECVIEDPACNTPDGLRERLARWRAER